MPSTIVGRHARPAVLEPIPGVRIRRQLGAGHEQLALEAENQVRQVTELDRQHAEPILEPELGPCEAERGHGFVDRAVGLGAEVVLGDPLAAVEEAGRAIVALAGRDGRCEVFGHHMRPASRGSQRSASSVTLTS